MRRNRRPCPPTLPPVASASSSTRRSVPSVCSPRSGFFGAEPRPWGVAAGWAAATALVFGPIAWVVRDRVAEERRKTLTYVAAGAGILFLVVWFGVALAFAPRLFPFGPGFVAGVAAGTLLVLVAERTVVPARLRGGGL